MPSIEIDESGLTKGQARKLNALRKSIGSDITAGTTMKNTTTLSSKFQITIPKEVREARNWKPG